MKATIQSPETRSHDHRRIGVIIALGFVILLSLVQLYESVIVIPRFADIFRDMLGDRPLSTLTATVLACRWVLVGIACILPLTASFIVRLRASLCYLLAILALLLFQIVFITTALFLPLIGMIEKFAPAQ